MLLFFDGFDYLDSDEYDTDSLKIAFSKWDTIGVGVSAVNVAGRISGSALTLGGPSGLNPADLLKCIPASTTVIIGFGFKINQPDDTTRRVVSFNHNPTTVHCYLAITPAGKLTMRDSANAAYESPETGDVTLANDTWYYIEVKVTISNTGSFEVRVDGVTDSAATGVDTLNGTVAECNVIRIGPPSASTPMNMRLDDLYICNDEGAANNDFLGDVRVVTLRPVGNGSSSQWTGSDGNSTDNYALVDETPNNNDTDYVKYTAAGNVDRYALGNLPHNPSVIHGVQVGAVAKRDDIAEGVFVTLLRIGATDYKSGRQPAFGSYFDGATLYEYDPSSGSPAAAWTPAVVNALEVGIEAE